MTTQQAKEKIDSIIDQAAIKCLDLFGNRLEAYILTEKEYRDLKNKKLAQTIKEGIGVISNERKT